jgi:DNA-binding transcriptional LysR family regulator
MNIEYLRNFVKLIEYKNFSELAKHLPISQSTLSHQISQLEKDFGDVLINRTTKKFELTKAGEILLNYSKQITDLYDTCKLEISEIQDQKLEEIVISASTIPGSHILPRFIADFRNKNPMAIFKILINNSEQSIENLKSNLADFSGIGSFMGHEPEEFDYIKIGEDEFKFICSPRHKLLKDGTNNVEFKNLIKFPFIWREKGSGMRKTFTEQFPEYVKLDIELEVNDNDSIISTVSDSNYISIMSELMADKSESAGLIKTLNIIDYPQIARRSLFFLKLKKRKLSKLKMKFWDEIESQTRTR